MRCCNIITAFLDSTRDRNLNCSEKSLQSFYASNEAKLLFSLKRPTRLDIVDGRVQEVQLYLQKCWTQGRKFSVVKPVHTVEMCNSPRLWYERRLLQYPTK